jgi:hypothetical protein
MRRAAVVQYRTSADSAEHNRNLIEDILIELGTCDPGGLDYQVFEFEDGVGFLHLAVFDGTTDPFADCGAHREFHRELQQRLAAPPITNRAVLIGSYFGSRRGDA